MCVEYNHFARGLEYINDFNETVEINQAIKHNTITLGS